MRKSHGKIPKLYNARYLIINQILIFYKYLRIGDLRVTKRVFFKLTGKLS